MAATEVRSRAVPRVSIAMYSTASAGVYLVSWVRQVVEKVANRKA